MFLGADSEQPPGSPPPATKQRKGPVGGIICRRARWARRIGEATSELIHPRRKAVGVWNKTRRGKAVGVWNKACRGKAVGVWNKACRGKAVGG